MIEKEESTRRWCMEKNGVCFFLLLPHEHSSSEHYFISSIAFLLQHFFFSWYTSRDQAKDVHLLQQFEFIAEKLSIYLWLLLSSLVLFLNLFEYIKSANLWRIGWFCWYTPFSLSPVVSNRMKKCTQIYVFSSGLWFSVCLSLVGLFALDTWLRTVAWKIENTKNRITCPRNRAISQPQIFRLVRFRIRSIFLFAKCCPNNSDNIQFYDECVY